MDFVSARILTSNVRVPDRLLRESHWTKERRKDSVTVTGAAAAGSHLTSMQGETK